MEHLHSRLQGLGLQLFVRDPVRRGRRLRDMSLPWRHMHTQQWVAFLGHMLLGWPEPPRDKVLMSEATCPEGA